MPETTLDRMVRKSVKETLNAMPATRGAWCTSNATSSPGSTPATARSDGARVRYITSNEWSTRRYLDMSRLGETVGEANRSSPQGRAKTKVRKI